MSLPRSRLNNAQQSGELRKPRRFQSFKDRVNNDNFKYEPLLKSQARQTSSHRDLLRAFGSLSTMASPGAPETPNDIGSWAQSRAQKDAMSYDDIIYELEG